MRLIKVIQRTLYATWWWFVMAFSFALAWCAVMSLPRLDWRWQAVRKIARAALVILRAPVIVSGIDRIPGAGAILVFNHSSYMDGPVLAAVLPGQPAFVAKRELAQQTFAGPFLRRLGALFVERYNINVSLADAELVVVAAQQGRNIVFFPEGTFTRRPGLTAFYLGAFKVAADARLPVLPGIIRGTRSMLRGDQWFPQWSPISVRIEDPVNPMGTGFASVLQLRDTVRKVVLSNCGEPDIGDLVKPPAISSSA